MWTSVGAGEIGGSGEPPITKATSPGGWSEEKGRPGNGSLSPLSEQSQQGQAPASPPPPITWLRMEMAENSDLKSHFLALKLMKKAGDDRSEGGFLSSSVWEGSCVCL